MSERIKHHENGILLDSDHCATMDLSLYFGDDTGGLTFALSTVREHVEIRITPSGLLRIYNKRKSNEFDTRRLTGETDDS